MTKSLSSFRKVLWTLKSEEKALKITLSKMGEKKRGSKLILHFQWGELNLVFSMFVCPIHGRLRILKVEKCSPHKECPTAYSVSLVCECSLTATVQIYLIPCTCVSTVQLALEQHRFELWVHLYVDFFFNQHIGKYTCRRTSCGRFVLKWIVYLSFHWH